MVKIKVRNKKKVDYVILIKCFFDNFFSLPNIKATTIVNNVEFLPINIMTFRIKRTLPHRMKYSCDFMTHCYHSTLLPLLLVQSCLFFLFPAFFVEFGEALEDFDAGGFGNCVADIIGRRKIANLMEAMTKINVAPAVGVADSLVDLALQLAKFHKSRIVNARIMELIVKLSETNLVHSHD